ARPRGRPWLSLQQRRLLIGGVVAGVLIVAAIVWSVSREKPNQSVTIESSENNAQEDKEPGWHGWPKEAPPPAVAPFDADEAKKHQQAWAEYLEVPVEFTNKIGMKFRLIPPGEFTMGCSSAEVEETLLQVPPQSTAWREYVKSEAPPHWVILTQPFYLGVHEVTQQEYEQIMGAMPSHWAATGAGKTEGDTSRHPVDMVSWEDAAEFFMKLSQLERRELGH